MEKAASKEFQERIARVEKLITALDGVADQQLRMEIRELVQTLLELHQAGLERALEMIYDSENAGAPLIDKLAENDLVSKLLLLHGLHPLSLETRVRSALESVKPRLGLHGGNVELIAVTVEGGIKLRLEGNCHGCPSSRITLKSSIEEAIYEAAPDVTGLEVEGAVDSFVNATPGPAAKFTVCPT
jgi:Fe-S cluster biogenesis protein NfuA